MRKYRADQKIKTDALTEAYTKVINDFKELNKKKVNIKRN